MNTREIKLGLCVIIFLGLIFAFKTGNYIADEDYGPPAIAFGSLLFLSVLFGLGNSIYILIPICWGLTAGIPILPLPFSVRQIAILIATVFFISGFIFKRNRIQASFEMVDLLVAINLLYLVTVFVRNPVGFAAIGGGERVGGKPYVDVVLGVLAYWMLSRFRLSPSLSKKLPYWMLGSSLFDACVGAFATFLPEYAVKFGTFYSGFDPSGAGVIVDMDDTSGMTRLSFFQNLGRDVVLLVVSRINPTLLFGVTRLGSLVLYLAGFVMILFSGFRNAIISSLLVTALSMLIRERFIGFFKVILFLIMAATSVTILSYMPLKLPFSFQRALCFLPGNWDDAAKKDATDSSEWRFVMWQTVLTTDRYIHDKVFGDGFGFLRSDYDRMLDLEQGYITNFSDTGEYANQEVYMLNGDFHSGPIGTIRFVGIVGLILFLPLLFYTGWYAYRIIRKAQGTPYQFCAFFIGLPVIMLPFFFTLIVGDYRQDLVNVLFDIGMIKMLSGSVDDYNKTRLFVPDAVVAKPVRHPMLQMQQSALHKRDMSTRT